MSPRRRRSAYTKLLADPPGRELASAVYELACYRELQKRLPILRLRPRLEVVEGDVGKLTVERGAIDRVADAIEPFVHFDPVLAHALADDIERNLVIGEGAAGDARENGDDVIPRQIVAREVEALAREATGVLEDANGDRPDVRDGDL